MTSDLIEQKAKKATNKLIKATLGSILETMASFAKEYEIDKKDEERFYNIINKNFREMDLVKKTFDEVILKFVSNS